MPDNQHGMKWQCWLRRQGTGPAVVVAGRPVEVDLALSQDAARTLAASKATAVGSDSRNLYLVSPAMCCTKMRAFKLTS